MPGLYKSVGGEFSGGCDIRIGVLWTGPKAKKFKGIRTFKPKTNYTPSEIVSVKEMGREQVKSFLGSAVGAGAGTLLFGGIGLVAGALAGGNRNKTLVAVEFSDGKKIAFLVKQNDKLYQCLKLFASEKQMMEYSF